MSSLDQFRGTGEGRPPRQPGPRMTCRWDSDAGDYRTNDARGAR